MYERKGRPLPFFMEKLMKKAVLPGIKADLTLKSGAIPTLKAGEALIALKAAALNKRDWWIQQGLYAGLRFPLVPGSDGSGIVADVGHDADQSWVGKSVIINPAFNWGQEESHQGPDFQILGLPQDGTFAEYVKVPVTQLHAKPEHLSFEEAAAIPLVGLTTYRALFTRADLKPGEKLFISGIGGGAATMALQLAAAVHAEIYVSSSQNHKIEQAIALGAKGGVIYTQSNWAETLQTEAGQFHVVLDSALGDSFESYLELCQAGGRIVFFGGTAGNIPELNGRRVFWKQLNIMGTTMGSPLDFKHMLAFVEQHKIKPVIEQIFPLEDINMAFQKLNDPSAFGKIVIQI